MVIFNELRITPDNKNLIVDVTVKNSEMYEDIYLDTIVIDNSTTYVSNGPSNNPIYKYTLEPTPIPVYASPDNCNRVLEEETKDPCYVYDETDKYKSYRIVLDNTDIEITNDIYFIYIIVNGVPHIDTPCGMDNTTTMGVITNLYGVYQGFMQYIREVESDCNISKNFINQILRYKAFELAVSTGNYILAIKYWNKYFKDKPIMNKPTNKCYGTIGY